jgi:ubiquinone/menaquinone biosynthesis C-methylase UbiE
MTALPRAEASPELLDEPLHELHILAESLGHIAAVNRWLGGTHCLLKHITPLLNPDQPTTILDVGTGSADLSRSVIRHARRHSRVVEVTACDVHPQILAIARVQSAGFPELSICPANALALPFEADSFDVGTLSLTLHHFDGDEQVQVLRELARVARRCVIVNELRRTRLNYLGARFLATTVWRGNRLTRHDGPLSVLRAFTPAELRLLATAAGMRGVVFKHYFQRVVLVATPSERGPVEG